MTLKPFYLFLMVLWGALVFYTGYVAADQGLNLFAVFFGDMASWTWAGHFNLDFSMLLFLSASWTFWRSGFSATGFVLAAIAFVGGAAFLLPYLTYLSWKHDGNTAAALLGAHSKEPTS